MSDANLITLLEIAEKIDVNYRTLISCKREFSDFVFSMSQGRINKYSPEYIDFFRLIFALKDEGYLNPDIKMMLSREIPSNINNHLKSWINEWKDKLSNPQFRMDGLTDEPINGLTDGLTDEPTNGLMDGPVDGPINGLMDEPINGLTDGLMDELKQEILTALPEMITEQIQSISDRYEATLSDLTAQVNGAITQLYKAVTELQLEYKDLHARLAHLEKELGASPAPNPVLIELDLESMQVKLEKPEPVLQHATMEFVKASISDGKPDKLSVVQWIQAEREKNPSVSYAELAEMLDEAGVPTLRGSVGWHRGTIRNLILK